MPRFFSDARRTAVHDKGRSRNVSPKKDDLAAADAILITLSIVNMGMGQNLVPLVNIKIAGEWMFIPLKMYL